MSELPAPAAEEPRKCSSCDAQDTALFTLIIPPIITEKTDLM
jgi:hypothetical protein